MARAISRRGVYRTWEDGNAKHFLHIRADGMMKEITLEPTSIDEKVKVCKTRPLSPLNPDAFRKMGTIIKAKAFKDAQRKAIHILTK